MTYLVDLSVFVFTPFIIPVIYSCLSMMDSMNTYKVKETCDAYLLADRMDDLEKDVLQIRELLEDITIRLDLHEEQDTLNECTSDIEQLQEEQNGLEKDIHLMNSYVTLSDNLSKES